MNLRRVLALGLSAAVGGGFVATATVAGLLTFPQRDYGTRVESFHGLRQNGIELDRQSNATFLALDFKSDLKKEAIGRWMRVLTSDASLLSQGKSIIGDPQGEMSENPARLTITFGFGYSLFKKVNNEAVWPLEITTLPSFSIDKLQSRWSGGDLLIQIAGDNPLSIFHAAHVLQRDSQPFASLRWQQRGFLDPAGINEGKTTRNLMGQLDGSANPQIGTKAFHNRTWKDNTTSLVIRRIEMNLGTWDSLSANVKSEVIGRSLKDGAPLSGGNEKSKPNFTMKFNESMTAISKSSHLRRAFTQGDLGLVRRGYNYDDGYESAGNHEVGLIFVSYQMKVKQFVEIQKRLATLDSLNQWTTPIGSALFFIPEGVTEGEWIGQRYFS